MYGSVVAQADFFSLSDMEIINIEVEKQVNTNSSVFATVPASDASCSRPGVY